MYDAVHVLAHALQQVDHSTRLRLVNLSCDGNQAWAFGSSLYNYLNLVSGFVVQSIASIGHKLMGYSREAFVSETCQMIEENRSIAEQNHTHNMLKRLKYTSRHYTLSMII